MPRVTFGQAFVFAPHPRVRQSFKPGGTYMVTQAAAEAARLAGKLADAQPATPPGDGEAAGEGRRGRRGARGED